MEKVRVILVTNDRKAALDEAREDLLKDEEG